MADEVIPSKILDAVLNRTTVNTQRVSKTDLMYWYIHIDGYNQEAMINLYELAALTKKWLYDNHNIRVFTDSEGYAYITNLEFVSEDDIIEHYTEKEIDAIFTICNRYFNA